MQPVPDEQVMWSFVSHGRTSFYYVVDMVEKNGITTDIKES